VPVRFLHFSQRNKQKKQEQEADLSLRGKLDGKTHITSAFQGGKNSTMKTKNF